MVDLIAWLRAQLDNDERVALGVKAGCWLWNDYIDGAGQAFMERLAEDRWLAEIEAKRRIIKWLAEIDIIADAVEVYSVDVNDALRLLALPYASQPGYRDEWRL